MVVHIACHCLILGFMLGKMLCYCLSKLLINSFSPSSLGSFSEIFITFIKFCKSKILYLHFSPILLKKKKKKKKKNKANFLAKRESGTGKWSIMESLFGENYCTSILELMPN